MRRQSSTVAWSLVLCILALAGIGWASGALLAGVAAGDGAVPVDRTVQAFVAHREGWLTVAMRGGTAWLLSLLVVTGVVGGSDHTDGLRET
jgi:hypothetical protein